MRGGERIRRWRGSGLLIYCFGVSISTPSLISYVEVGVGGLRQRHSNDQQINLLLQEFVYFRFTCPAVPRARERTVWVTGPRDDVTIIFLRFGRVAG